MFLTLIRNTLLLLFFIISFSFVSLAQKNSKKAFISHEHVSLELISSVNSIHKENNLHYINNSLSNYNNTTLSLASIFNLSSKNTISPS